MNNNHSKMMDDLRIPPNINYDQQYIQTPNNGLLYRTGNVTVVYISPIIEPNTWPTVHYVYTKNWFKSIDCSPDWSVTKQFAIIDTLNHVTVWDVDLCKPICGHKAHSKGNNEECTESGVICYVKNGTELLSACNGKLVKYCIASNTYTSSTAKQLIRNAFCTMKACPFNDDLIAVGTTQGLVIIFNLIDLSRLHFLRGHDTKITSLEWMFLNVPMQNVDQTPKKSTTTSSTRKIPQILDQSDMFDAYAFDHLDNEFGALSEPIRNVPVEKNATKPEIGDNENFDFVEACQNLRDDILRTSPDDYDDESGKKVSNSEVTHDELELINDFEHIDKSIDLSSGFDDEHDENDDINEDFNETIEYPEGMDNAKCNGKGKIFLATGTKEKFIWIWDVVKGVSVHKIEIKLKGFGLTEFKTSLCWLNDINRLISNSLNGNVISHQFSIDQNGKIRSSKQVVDALEDIQCTSVMSKCGKSISKDQISSEKLWIQTRNKQIICVTISQNEKTEILAKFSTLPITIYDIRECPQDLNKIAVAGNGKRINIFNITNLNQIKQYCNKIQSKVLGLAWHPIDENLLAFSTVEGRVGLCDTSKLTNSPEIMPPFTGHSVYQISWAELTINDKRQWVLFACGKGNFVYFNEYGKNKFDCVKVNVNKEIMSVSAGQRCIAFGTHCGFILLYSKELKELWSTKVSNKYITECAWSSVNPSKLAVCSMENDIHLFSYSDEEQAKSLGQLCQHRDAVVCIRWSNQSEHRLVSNSLDGMVCVWDTEHMECLSLYRYDTKIFCSIFSPINDNFIICAGQNETIHMFDMTKHRFDNNPSKSLAKKKSTSGEFKWATEIEIDVRKRAAKELKLQKKREKKAITNEIADDVLVESVQKLSISANNTQMQYTTILHLTKKEFNKNVFNCFYAVLDAKPNGDKDTKSLHGLLFSTRDDVKEMLETEYNHVNSNTDSIGRLIIPTMNSNLRELIMHHIQTKTLTEQHVMMAPMISHDFWQKCCKAFAFQMIEKGCTLLALPCLLCCHKIDEAIEALCDSNFYREAWILAKLHRDDEHSVFDSISNKWIEYLESNGNLDGAALIAVSVKKYSLGLNLLSKKRNRCEDTVSIINMLESKLSN